jgi:phosphocarrier protein HPr
VSKTATANVTVANRLGLHARPAMLLVERATQWKSDIKICRPDQDLTVDGKSIMQLMMLAATKGTELTITADGEDADEAAKSLAEFVANGFNED